MRDNRRRTRGRAERGIAIALTALVMIPLLIFAAFGVDLAAWYARISELQRAADAAALAGAVWMPNLTRATTEANANLLANGFVDGADHIDIVVAQGSTATSLRVTITDQDVDRYFSAVFRSGPATLTRYAEAEYNLPLPLGSPLNYFGGDSTQTQPATPPPVWSVNWPADSSTRAPTNGPCNVGTATDTGRWNSTPAFEAGQLYTSGTGNRRCTWEPLTSVVSAPPVNATLLAPTNVPCNVQQTPTSAQGRWNTGTPPTYTNNRFTGTAGSGNRQCTWRVTTTADLRSDYTSFPPVNRGCNVPPFGRWQTGGTGVWQPNQFTNSGTENRICQWTSDVSSVTPPTPPNPIPADRSPGFWAMIYGPGQYQANGDAYSTRCLNVYNCGSVQNAQYLPTTDPNRGFWYVIDVPAGVTGTIDVNVFDASYNIGSNRLMDSTENGGSGSDADFQTEFRVYRQTNPLDFTLRTPLFGSSASQSTTNGGCWWQLRAETGFHRNWARLCSITGVSGGERYLVNVRTNSVGAANSAGNNGYAMEAVLNGNRYASPGPSLYAHANMGMANQNTCSPTPCTPPPGVFYLAKVAPQYAGRTLVVELFDAGDMSGSTNAFVYPMMPSPSIGTPRPVVPVSDLDCTWTATPDPNPVQSPGFEPARTLTGVRVRPDPQPSDVSGRCGVQTSINGTRQFNGEWLRIRVQIPDDYDCNPALNDPENSGFTCWWGIRYEFANGGASDITTWQARIEGNPLQLTQ